MSSETVARDKIAIAGSRLTREQQAIAELGSTRYAAGVRQTLVIVFMLTILSVPAFEGSFGLFALPSWREITSSRPDFRVWSAFLLNPWRVRFYESTVTLDSEVGKRIRPWIQWVLTGWLGTGSEQVYVGRDGWLFYKVGVSYVTGPPFLDQAQLAARSANGYQPDPRKAIEQFHDVLKTTGVSLVILPIPEKAALRPRSFSPDVEGGHAGVQNASFEAFMADLRRRGISLLDLSPEMYRQENEGQEQFQRNDTHWAPRGADVAARALADYLTSEVGLPPRQRVAYSRRQFDFTRGADLVDLLDLPLSQQERLFPREHLTAQHVVDSSGSRWQPDPSSDILLIGDSFLEMFSTEGVARLPAAGLAEQLSYYLQRPVDRIASHRWRVYGAREALGDTLQRVRERARGRKVVVWEFAIRELARGDWKLMD